MVKDFPERPGTLAIGSGIGDILMMTTADISINVENSNICSDVISKSTISCSDFSSVYYFILRHGVLIQKILQNIALLYIYRLALISTLIVPQLIIMGSTGSA